MRGPADKLRGTNVRTSDRRQYLSLNFGYRPEPAIELAPEAGVHIAERTFEYSKIQRTFRLLERDAR